MENKGTLVEIFRALKNPTKFGLVIGEVKAPLPDILIDIGSEIILDKTRLMFCAGILKDYEREYKIKSTDMQSKGTKLETSGIEFSATAPTGFVIDSVGTTATPRPVVSVPEGGATTSYTANATKFDLESNDFKSTGKITLTDELKKGDLVALVAMESNQNFLVIDKVLSFE